MGGTIRIRAGGAPSRGLNQILFVSQKAGLAPATSHSAPCRIVFTYFDGFFQESVAKTVHYFCSTYKQQQEERRRSVG
jgi:hypothetical protein